MIFKRGNKIVGEIKFKAFHKTIKESRHLVWSLGGVPAIDKSAWDNASKYVDRIIIRTDKERTFVISTDRFNLLKKELNFGYGVQYYVLKEDWEIKTADKLPIKDFN